MNIKLLYEHLKTAGSMHPELKRKVRESLRIILDNPYEGKPLKDELSGLRSLRVGRFRIIYRLDQNVVAAG